MKKIYYIIILITMLSACHEGLEKRAEREAREYTEKFCPTPIINYTRTDSVKFDTEKKNYIYYCSFHDAFDNENIVRKSKDKISEGLYESISTNTGMKVYIDAGFSFTYIVRSGSNPTKVLYTQTIKINQRSKRADKQ